MKSALLLSGGMDSIALAWWKRPDVAITIDYGQRAAEAELSASKAICNRLDIEHVELTMSSQELGSGDMAGKAVSRFGNKSDWWPYRNQFLVTVAGMRLIEFGVNNIMLASVRTDESHVDGTQGFIERLNSVMSIQEGHVKITAPAIRLSTFELVKKSELPPELLAWAHSCHKANVPCGNCRGCNKYLEVYNQLDELAAYRV